MAVTYGSQDRNSRLDVTKSLDLEMKSVEILYFMD